MLSYLHISLYIVKHGRVVASSRQITEVKHAEPG